MIDLNQSSPTSRHRPIFSQVNSESDIRIVNGSEMNSAQHLEQREMIIINEAASAQM